MEVFPVAVGAAGHVAADRRHGQGEEEEEDEYRVVQPRVHELPPKRFFSKRAGGQLLLAVLPLSFACGLPPVGLADQRRW